MDEEEKTTNNYVDELRVRVDRETRFKRVLMGYQPRKVDEYIEELRESTNEQLERMEREQQTLSTLLNTRQKEADTWREQFSNEKEKTSNLEASVSQYMQEAQTLKERAEATEQENERLDTELRRARGAEEELAVLREERGELQAKTLNSAHALEQSQECIRRLEERNRDLQDQLEKLIAQMKAYKLEMLEGLAKTDALRKHTVTVLGEKLTECTRLLEICGTDGDQVSAKVHETLNL
ncbi:MAG: hypothetical protein VB111_04340 [Clostridiaceae bacterium]|nr:hypothetical protein [Clostridiaceae bacterium]